MTQDKQLMPQLRFQTSPVLLFLLAAALLLPACRPAFQAGDPTSQDRLVVVATTTFLGDVVRQVAGDHVDLKILLAPGQNPHSYLASPRDLVVLSEADLIIVNGLGLEEFLDTLLQGLEGSGRLVVASQGIQARAGGEGHQDQPGAEGLEASLGVDPHVWMDPNNVAIWVRNISEALVQDDPDNQAAYQANARAYTAQLQDLDRWIKAEIEKVPPEDRELVSDHISLGYFADRYGLEQIGAVIPALTTEAETSGQQLAELIEIIRDRQARAVFVGVDFDPTLAQRVSDETGAELVRLYFGSLSAGPPADTYLSFMRYNVQAISQVLQE